jgi:DNA repair exonuclease SbcCD nuclease subunit
MKKFIDDVFFPTLRSHGIVDIYHLGDLVDRRKYINFNTARRLREDFLDPLQGEGFSMHIIAGNHDTYYKNTNEVNALDEMLFAKYDNIQIYTNLADTYFPDGSPVLLLPWICDENREKSIQAINKTIAQVAFGHLELAGFDLFRGHKNEHGDDPNLFSRFDLVCSGHYHTRSNSSNIFYLGTPAQYTWSDYSDDKGFHILDTNTRALSFIENPHTSFKKFFYDDLNKQMDEVLLFDVNDFKDCYVKVVVKNKTNPYWFDLVIDRLEKSGAADLQVVEDHFNLDLEADSDIVNEAEDTMSIVRKFIGSMNINTDKKRVENIIQNLYIEAHQIL